MICARLSNCFKFMKSAKFANIEEMHYKILFIFNIFRSF